MIAAQWWKSLHFPDEDLSAENCNYRQPVLASVGTPGCVHRAMYTRFLIRFAFIWFNASGRLGLDSQCKWETWVGQSEICPHWGSGLVEDWISQGPWGTCLAGPKGRVQKEQAVKSLLEAFDLLSLGPFEG